VVATTPAGHSSIIAAAIRREGDSCATAACAPRHPININPAKNFISRILSRKTSSTKPA
jgi:hypothetical protein